MILKIVGVMDQPDQSNQRLALDVIEDGNLSYYAVVDNTYKEGIPTNLHQHYYSFPNHPVKKNDRIYLYSSRGTNRSIKMQSGTTVHFFFWDLKVSVWNPKDTAHLLKIMESKDIEVKTK